MNAHDEEFLISAYLDGELSASEKTRIDSHLPSCPSCRSELEAQRATKRLLGSAPRRAMPPALAAAIEAQVSRTFLSWRWLPPPRIAIPIGAFATAALLMGLWTGLRHNDPDQFVPLEPLLAAHSRYTAEALVPQGSLVASNYSAPLSADYAEPQEQETE